MATVITKGSRVGGKVAKRRVSLKPGHGKLRGRVCVRVDLAPGDPQARSAVRGVKLARTRFYGCFTSAAEARKAALRLATLGTLPRGRKRARRRGRR